jgi:hypothetical protein
MKSYSGVGELDEKVQGRIGEQRGRTFRVEMLAMISHVTVLKADF